MQLPATQGSNIRDYGSYSDGDSYTPGEVITVSLRDAVGDVVFVSTLLQDFSLCEYT